MLFFITIRDMIDPHSCFMVKNFHFIRDIWQHLVLRCFGGDITRNKEGCVEQR